MSVSAEQPEVSVIVPARNEEANLADCLRSLVGQPGPSYEIIVVDDHSTDRTREIAEGFPVTVIAADPLPAGWSGKCNACWSGAKVAKGKWLLFTDADTQHSANSIAAGIARGAGDMARPCSLTRRSRRYTVFAERALMPVIFAELATTYRPKEVSDPNSPAAAANGQYLLIRRDAYDAVGGHAAVAQAILEDVELAKRVKQRRLQAAVSPVGCGQHAHVSQLRADVGGMDEEPRAAVSEPAVAGGKARAGVCVDRHLCCVAVAVALPIATWIGIAINGVLAVTLLSFFLSPHSARAF